VVDEDLMATKAKNTLISELLCSGCSRLKFRGLFAPSQQRKSDTLRLCMECVSEKNKVFKRGKGRQGDAWRNGGIAAINTLFPNS
jgi:hypothetical protein